MREHQELLSGIVASEIRNALYSFASEPPKPALPADFMPSQWAKQKTKAPRINRQRIVDKVRGFLMGQVQRKP